jgi:hypothetical protein
MSAALAFAPLLAAQADEVGGEEIVVPTIIEQEEIVIIQEAPVSLPPPGMTRENAQASEDEASSR